MRVFFKLFWVIGAMIFALPVLAAQGIDKNLPVEITADSLTVLQQKQQATFTGNVEAIQGIMRLYADEMTVYYTQKNGKASTKKESEAKNKVSKIKVKGNVRLVTPKETAKGDRGKYDVLGSEITLDGNVVLTQGKSIVRGSHLVYNLSTGKSTISSPKAKGEGSKKGKNQRVKGVFVPSE